ncbi:AT-HOOK MOTIF NUCLEAR-LOCALIZED PROTEIN 3 [Salix viminalis]|uniref:AT-hook motif nuclear-localized protein n=1 Tax=Salix viminalis TaxID=40686 RepID=A0A9Q0SG70_SALVM|nr:AT-HOOK MOTIF NUCLEAR-LOCALIZED PROTEIN 3 [Salix viminalis]
MPTENGGTKSRSGGMSVSLAGPDGRVVGGGLAGLLVAAGPVQVVVGSFLPGHQQESKNKKQRIESAPAVIPATINIFSPEEMKGSYGGVRPVAIPSPSFHGDNPASFNPMQAFRDPISDNRSSSPDDGSKGPDHSNSNSDSARILIFGGTKGALAGKWDRGEDSRVLVPPEPLEMVAKYTAH